MEDISLDDLVLATINLTANNVKILVPENSVFDGTAKVISNDDITIKVTVGTEERTLTQGTDYEIKGITYTGTGLVNGEPVNVGTDYKAVVEIEGKGVYSTASGEGETAKTTLTVESDIYAIAQADAEYTAPTGLEATYGDKLSSVNFTNPENGTFAWENADENATVGNVNAEGNEFTVKFTPASDNYKTVTGINVKVVVKAKSITSEDVTATQLFNMPETPVAY